MPTLDVIWEDAHGLAVNKPAGLLTQQAQSGEQEPTLEALVRDYLRPANPASVYLGTVHRLDRPVSGVILWAKTPKAAHRWADQFAKRTTRKEYWAILDRDPAESHPLIEQWDDWLTRPDQSGQARVVDARIGSGLLARTRVAISDPARLIRPGAFTWCKLFPETGRTHQLRAQAASRGTPIVGDWNYGSQTRFDAGIALHARRLTIDHPARHEPMTIEAELPHSWSAWLTTD